MILRPARSNDAVEEIAPLTIASAFPSRTIIAPKLSGSLSMYSRAVSSVTSGCPVFLSIFPFLSSKYSFPNSSSHSDSAGSIILIPVRFTPFCAAVFSISLFLPSSVRLETNPSATIFAAACTVRSSEPSGNTKLFLNVLAFLFISATKSIIFPQKS